MSSLLVSMLLLYYQVGQCADDAWMNCLCSINIHITEGPGLVLLAANIYGTVSYREPFIWPFYVLKENFITLYFCCVCG